MKRISSILGVTGLLLLNAHAGSFGVKNDIVIPKQQKVPTPYILSDTTTSALIPCDIPNINIDIGKKNVSTTLYSPDGNNIMVVNRNVLQNEKGYVVNTTCSLDNILSETKPLVSYNTLRYLNFDKSTRKIEKTRFTGNIKERTNTCIKHNAIPSNDQMGVGDEFYSREDFLCNNGQLLVEVSREEEAGDHTSTYHHMKTFLETGESLDIAFLKRANGSIKNITIKPDIAFSQMLYTSR
ncbi:MAG: Unknown protein [uncultured Sulfurovum sp.]|uniref:Uncharacterized protein n=1 Tax=uncultured Sulfurovum sp. TaxID=269237 RepID=A0A6S6SX95_9BACT|nr:MAG: Unknown protein [uncultured Sulfurovum sp.]